MNPVQAFLKMGFLRISIIRKNPLGTMLMANSSQIRYLNLYLPHSFSSSRAALCFHLLIQVLVPWNKGSKVQISDGELLIIFKSLKEGVMS